jgi:hypothetical protein
MPERAIRRCPSCGAPLIESESCRTEWCSTNQDTIRPRPSQTECRIDPRPSSEFQIRENGRTTLRDLIAPDGNDEWDDGMDDIPAQSRVPDFPDHALAAPQLPADDEIGAPPTTRRETPLPPSSDRHASE